MCGIAGYYSFNKSLPKSVLHEMTSAIRHRGPDAEGFFANDFVGLGHRRLSILDLSEGANQPMTSHNERFIIIYNGEVYNFKEIAKELNTPFSTTSDTEVILEAYVKWGADMLQKLNGMFALAIYDKQDNTIFIARDRMGIKPLYYYWDGELFVFASELKALLKVPFINNTKSINKNAVNQFLYLGYVPEPNSIFNSVKKFPSGSYLLIDKEKFEIKQFWTLEEQVTENVISDFNQAKAELKNTLAKSVEYRLISDVPFGTFLSGGIDSSLVTAVAQSVSSKPINTFSIGFKESDFNEAKHAKKVAKHLGTNHHEFYVSYKEAIELFESILDVYDEPFADSSSVPTMLVSKLARKHVTMTLSGDGGDETYLGYGSYNWAKRLNNPLVKLLRKPLRGILSNLSPRFERASHLFAYPSKQKIKSHIFSQEQYYFTELEIGNLLNPEYLASCNIDETFENLNRKVDAVEEQALFDMKYYLKDDLLVKVDRASMNYSLETRVPLLDHNLMAFALNVDKSLKVRGGTYKYLLKELLYDYVPRELFDRPKWGFAMPIGKWLKVELRYLIEDYLNDTVVKQAGLVKLEMVKPLLNQFFRGKYYLYNRIWLLILLHKWYLKHF